MTVPIADADILMKKLHEISDIIAHEVTSWTPKHVDIHITHIEGTKKYALEQLLKLENVDKEYVMAAGDANNDLPLFAVAAYKVAMGNATQRLKDAADYVTDTVENDGLAKAIEEKLQLRVDN